ncbi:hypothetical protein [Clostridium baratii]|uniref:hypothetical protein n=1 Tax=Clostridium baratii TaxID=1561 RepID=UPI003D7AB711
METNKNNQLIKAITKINEDRSNHSKTMFDEEINKNNQLIKPTTKINEDERILSTTMDYEKINRNCYEEKTKVKSTIVKGTNERNYYSNNGDKLKCPIKKIGAIVIGEDEHLYLNTYAGEIDICNFNVFVEKIIIEDDGLNQSRKYKLICVLENLVEEKVIILEPSDLNNSNWIKNKLGIKYYLGSDYNAYKYLDKYISESAKFVREEIEYKQVGWKNINGKYVYLHGKGAIGCDDFNIHGNKEYCIDTKNYKIEYILKYSLLLSKISHNDEKSIFMFVYAHLAVLKELFSLAGAEPKFVLWIYGLTGSMKTSVSKIFFNLFNRSKDIKIPATFKDTPSDLEIKSFEYKDSSLLIDDYHPASSYTEKKDMESKASNILRMYGDGISKGRANKNMQKQKVYPPRGLCVITGEDFIGGESTIARYVGIEVNRNEFNKEILEIHQKEPLIFSTYMNYFIEWISYNFENIKWYIKDKFYKMRYCYKDEFNHPRLGEAYSILSITIDIIFMYFQYLKYNNELLKKEEWSQKIIDVIRTHEKNNFNEDPAVMYLIALKQLICSGQVKVNSIKDDSKNSYLIGFEDEEKYYLIPKIAFEKIKKFWKGQGIEFPLGENAIRKALENINAIEVSKEINSGKEVIRKTKKIRIGNITSRYLVIYKNIYNKLDII